MKNPSKCSTARSYSTGELAHQNGPLDSRPVPPCETSTTWLSTAPNYWPCMTTPSTIVQRLLSDIGPTTMPHLCFRPTARSLVFNVQAKLLFHLYEKPLQRPRTSKNNRTTPRRQPLVTSLQRFLGSTTVLAALLHADLHLLRSTTWLHLT